MTAGLAMLSTIVFCEDRLAAQIQARLAEVLARTLASLVTAKVEGILADVRIAGPAGAGLEAVANHAGCAFVEAAAEADWLRAALEAAKERLAFLLRCGFAPDPGFIEEAAEFLSLLPKGAPSMLLRAEPEAFLERLAPSLAPAARRVSWARSRRWAHSFLPQPCAQDLVTAKHNTAPRGAPCAAAAAYT